MAHRLAPLVLFLLATSMMFSVKKIEAIECSGITCSPFEDAPCGSTECSCVPSSLSLGECVSGAYVAKMIDEHSNLCKSDKECMKKGSGNFCARYPNPRVDYGWCFNSNSEELKGFLAMPRAISK